MFWPLLLFARLEFTSIDKFQVHLLAYTVESVSFYLFVPHACIWSDILWVLLTLVLFAVFAHDWYHCLVVAGCVAATGLTAFCTAPAITAVVFFILFIFAMVTIHHPHALLLQAVESFITIWIAGRG